MQCHCWRDELSCRPWGSQGEDGPWRAAEEPVWDSWQQPEQPPQQPGQPGRGVPALLPGPPDTGLHLHEPALPDEPAWALPAGIIPGELGLPLLFPREMKMKLLPVTQLQHLHPALLGAAKGNAASAAEQLKNPLNWGNSAPK